MLPYVNALQSKHVFGEGSRNCHTMSKLPSRDAICNGVHLDLVEAFTFVPCPMSVVTATILLN